MLFRGLCPAICYLSKKLKQQTKFRPQNEISQNEIEPYSNFIEPYPNFMSNHNFIVNPIVIGSNTIERVMTYKLLGVYVSNDLKWNHHVEVIVQKGNRRLCA